MIVLKNKMNYNLFRKEQCDLTILIVHFDHPGFPFNYDNCNIHHFCCIHKSCEGTYYGRCAYWRKKSHVRSIATNKEVIIEKSVIPK